MTDLVEPVRHQDEQPVAEGGETPRPLECLFARCTRAATAILRPKYGVDWRGCDEHYPAMERALWIGQPADSGSVQTIRLDAPAEPEVEQVGRWVR